MRLTALSLTLRLTALFAAVSTAVILVLGYLIGAAVEQHFVEQDMAVLSDKFAQTQLALQKAAAEGDFASVPQQIDEALVGHHGLAIAVIAPDGRTLFATRDAGFPGFLLETPLVAKDSQPMVWNSERRMPYRGFARRVPLPGAGEAVVAVATEISHHEQFMASFRMTLWLSVLAAALATGVLGWLAARRGLAPLRAMKHKAGEISAQRLDARLDVDAVPSELADLARTLNETFARLEASFRRLADFSTDLAHEFRSPISNLLMQAQVTLSRPRSVETYCEVLASSIEEYERLSRMISDMLLIALADEGQLMPHCERLDLSRLLGGLIEFHGLAAEEKGVSLSLEGEAVVMGDALMIRRAISNLLSNAIRHTPSGGAVSVKLRTQADGVVVDVVNTGETIPADRVPRLFDRFFRADASRTGEGRQSGLGLAIVKSIAEAHRGSVSAASEGGVTCFSLSLPA